MQNEFQHAPVQAPAACSDEEKDPAEPKIDSVAADCVVACVVPEKVITADVSIVNPEIMGVPVTVHVLVSIIQGSRTYGDFARKLKSRPEVKHASYVTGGADFVLHLQFESMAAYAEFAREIFHDDPNVAEYHTYVSMREIVGATSSR